jgi:hypothetical protein
MPQSAAKRPGERFGLVFWLIAGVAALAFGLGLPVIPCDSSCGNIYEERMSHARQPQVSREQAAAIRAWAVTDGCKICNNRGRMSLLYYLYLNDWSLLRSKRTFYG